MVLTTTVELNVVCIVPGASTIINVP